VAFDEVKALSMKFWVSTGEEISSWVVGYDEDVLVAVAAWKREVERWRDLVVGCGKEDRGSWVNLAAGLASDDSDRLSLREAVLLAIVGDVVARSRSMKSMALRGPRPRQ
jgi:hypothetical protein